MTIEQTIEGWTLVIVLCILFVYFLGGNWTKDDSED